MVFDDVHTGFNTDPGELDFSGILDTQVPSFVACPILVNNDVPLGG
jgi:hypothetical protein